MQRGAVSRHGCWWCGRRWAASPSAHPTWETENKLTDTCHWGNTHKDIRRWQRPLEIYLFLGLSLFLSLELFVTIKRRKKCTCLSWSCSFFPPWAVYVTIRKNKRKKKRKKMGMGLAFLFIPLSLLICKKKVEKIRKKREKMGTCLSCIGVPESPPHCLHRGHHRASWPPPPLCPRGSPGQESVGPEEQSLMRWVAL